MKLPPARVAAFLKDPGDTRLILLHGEDEGLIRERADAFTLLVAGAADDPFRVTWLADSTHARLPEEASAIAMLGGRRVIRVRDVADPLLPQVEHALAAPGDSLILLEAPSLTRRSKLLAAIEAAPRATALACYHPEPEAIRARIAASLDAAGIRTDRDTLDWLRDHLGADHASTSGEIEKLILYAGPTRTLDLDSARDCVGDQAATALDDAVYAATLGDLALADRSVERTLAEAGNPIGILRVLLAHLVRIHQARGRVDTGDAPLTAVKSLRPPVFWKREKDMVRIVETWPTQRIAAALAETRRAELACKQTGAPDLVITRRLITVLARQAASLRRR